MGKCPLPILISGSHIEGAWNWQMIATLVYCPSILMSIQCISIVPQTWDHPKTTALANSEASREPETLRVTSPFFKWFSKFTMCPGDFLDHPRCELRHDVASVTRFVNSLYLRRLQLELGNVGKLVPRKWVQIWFVAGKKQGYTNGWGVPALAGFLSGCSRLFITNHFMISDYVFSALCFSDQAISLRGGGLLITWCQLYPQCSPNFGYCI